MNFLLSLLLSIAAVVAAAAGDTRDTRDIWNVGRRVRTTSGFVNGHPAPNASRVSEYLGIPYAKPPVGALRFASPLAYVSQGTVDGSKFPVLIGNTDYEVGIIGLLAPAAYAALSPAARIAYNLVFFACPTAEAAFYRALHGIPTWRYRWLGEYTNTRLFPGSGAWHGSEIGFVFGTTEQLTGVGSEVGEEKVQRYMMRAWARFAKKPKKALGDLGWPRYNATGKTLVQLGLGSETTASFAFPATFDAACASVGQSAGP